MFKEYLITLIFICTSSMVFADANETGKITRLITEGHTTVSVWLDGEDDNSDCPGGSRWTITSDDLLMKEKYSMLLSAATTGKIVHLHGLASWGCGNWDSNKIHYVDITY